MNRQIGIADSKYAILDDPLPQGHVRDTAHAHCQLPLKWPIRIAFIHYLATDQDRSIKFGSKYA